MAFVMSAAPSHSQSLVITDSCTGGASRDRPRLANYLRLLLKGPRPEEGEGMRGMPPTGRDGRGRAARTLEEGNMHTAHPGPRARPTYDRVLCALKVILILPMIAHRSPAFHRPLLLVIGAPQKSLYSSKDASNWRTACDIL